MGFEKSCSEFPKNPLTNLPFQTAFQPIFSEKLAQKAT
jgi:hypothetical protein